MKRTAAVAYLLVAASAAPLTQTKEPPRNKELEALHAHFEKVVVDRHERAFSGITTVEQWERRKQEISAALHRMLWSDMRWPDAPPPATVTHRERHPAYTIENVVLETAPKVFLTANLYLPIGKAPFPVVLYQCGHANKSYFKRHGAWFAANGIAALVMDNIEMGEVEFTHHGVYSRAWFHWYSRGFSPLAVELLNARRAVDYLAARPDIDRNRIGATGRSGGGMATFFLAAIDGRIKASAPVSGTLSTTGWVKHRLSMAHCDCQYPVNSYGLLYSEIGALIAPRAQLLANADADRGFPMDAFTEMVTKMREIYRLHGAADALHTAVTPGGHTDTEAIRLPVYSFFMKELLGKDAPVTSEGEVDEPESEELICFRAGLPIDERLTRIDEELIPMSRVASERRERGTGAERGAGVTASDGVGGAGGQPPPRLRRPAGALAQAGAKPPGREMSRQGKPGELTKHLRGEVFRYFPEKPAPLQAEWSQPTSLQGRTIQKVTFTSFEGLRVRATYSLPAGTTSAVKHPAVLIVDHRKGIPVWGNEQPWERNQWGDRAVLIVETLDRGSRALEQNLRSFTDDDLLHHMKRQAMVAGTTLESMQLYEILRSLELLRSLPHVDPARITIVGKGEDGVNGMYAALLDGNAERVVLQSPPASHVHGPHYLGVLRYTDIPETARLLGARLRVSGEVPDPLRFASVCRSVADCLR